MENLAIIAQAVQSPAGPASCAVFIPLPLDSIWREITALSWMHAVLAVSFGAVYLVYGWRIFKMLVVICSGLAGLLAGIEIGSQFPAMGNTLVELHNLEIWTGIIMACFMAIIAIPLMKWAVSILGSISGGIVAIGIWRVCNFPEEYALAGMVVGLVAGGMICFIVFRMAVMLFTSVGGSILVTAGILSLLNRYESIQNPPSENIKTMFYHTDWFLPAFLLASTLIGMIIQSRLSRGSQN